MSDQNEQPTYRFNYTDRSYLELRDQLTAYVSNRIPQWSPGTSNGDGTLSDPSDFATVFLESVAYVGDLLSYYVDRAAMEASALTAVAPGNVLAWAELFGYVPALGRSAEVKLELTAPKEGQVTIPNKLLIRGTSDTPYIFEIQLPLEQGRPALNRVIPAGQTIEVTAWEGITKYVQGAEGYEAGTSDGSAAQNFVLPDTNIDTRDFWLDVIDADNTEAVIDTGKWTFTYHLLDAGPDDQVFTARVRADGKMYISFGDGTSGKIPPAGYAVYARYRTTSGKAGSGPDAVPPNSLNAVNGSWDTPTFAELSSLTITNPAPSYGGVNPDTLETSRKSTVEVARAQRRAVTARDYSGMALTHGEVLTAYCTALVWSRPSVWVLPRAPYVLTNKAAGDQILKEVQELLDSVAMVGSSVDVLMGRPQLLRLDITVHTWPTIRQSVVRRAVIDALVQEYTYENLRFEKPLTEEDIMFTISKSVPFRLVRYAVPDLQAVAAGQPIDYNPSAAIREPRRFLPRVGELLYLDTNHINVTVVGGIVDEETP